MLKYHSRRFIPKIQVNFINFDLFSIVFHKVSILKNIWKLCWQTINNVRTIENNYIVIEIEEEVPESTIGKSPDNEEAGNNNGIQINNAIEFKLTTQEVGEGYFHILFTIVYALYIGFALFHLHKNRFKLCIPCSRPRVMIYFIALLFQNKWGWKL